MAVCEPLILTEFRKPALHPIWGEKKRKEESGNKKISNETPKEYMLRCPHM